MKRNKVSNEKAPNTGGGKKGRKDNTPSMPVPQEEQSYIAPLNGRPQQATELHAPTKQPPAGKQSTGDLSKLKIDQMLESIKTGLFIRQHFEVLDIVTGCADPNKYVISELNDNQLVLLEARELNEWCERVYAPSPCRSLNIIITKGKREEANEGQAVLKFVKNNSCTCCTFGRPSLEVFLTENNEKENLGRVTQAYTFCGGLLFEIFDSEGTKIYTLDAECLQPGLVCKCPCEMCQSVTFELTTVAGQQKEAPLTKLGTTFCQNLCSRVDNFKLPFPPKATWQQKALLLGCVIMVDYMEFEKDNMKKFGNIL